MAVVKVPHGSLSFVNEDLRNQIAFGQGVLQQAKALQAALPLIADPEAKKRVEASISALLTLTNSLSSNIAVTTATASSTASGVSGNFLRWGTFGKVGGDD